MVCPRDPSFSSSFLPWGGGLILRASIYFSLPASPHCPSEESMFTYARQPSFICESDHFLTKYS